MKIQILFVTKFGYIILWVIPNLCNYIQKLNLLEGKKKNQQSNEHYILINSNAYKWCQKGKKRKFF